MKKITFILLFALTWHIGVAQVESFQYYRDEAVRLFQVGKFEEAIAYFKAAKVCKDAPKIHHIDAWIDSCYTGYVQLLKTERDHAEKEKRQAIANDFAFKAQSALKNKDRTSSYRLAEFAHSCLQVENVNLLQALSDSWYYNDLQSSERSRLPWNIKLLSGHTFGVMSVDWSPDGNKITSAALDGTFKVWDSSSGLELLSVSAHDGWTYTAKWSPDGSKLATGGIDKTIKIWNTSNGALIKTLKGHTDDVMSVAWSPDGKKLASSSDGEDRSIKIWDTGTWEEIASCRGHKGAVMSVEWSPDGTKLVSGSQDKAVFVWDVSTNDTLFTLKEFGGLIRCTDWSPNGAKIAVASDDGRVTIWDVATKTKTMEGNIGARVMSVAWSPNSNLLASGAYDNSIKIWNPENGTIIVSLAGFDAGGRCLAWSPDGKKIVSGTADSHLKIWEFPPTGESVKIENDRGWGNSIAWSPDGKKIAVGWSDGMIKIWDQGLVNLIFEYKGHNSLIHSLDWSADGKKLASTSVDGVVKIWDTTNGGIHTSFSPLAGDEVWSIAWSPDGKSLASGGTGGVLNIWSMEQQVEVKKYQYDRSSLLSIAWSPTGDLIAGGTLSGAVFVWDVKTGKLVATFTGHQGAVSKVVWSPDGKKLASGSFDYFVKIWEIEAKREIVTFAGHTSRVTDIDWSLDGSKVISGSFDGDIKLWNIQSGQEILMLSAHKEPVIALAFQPDLDFHFVSTDQGGNIIHWPSINGTNNKKQSLAVLSAKQLEDFGIEGVLEQAEMDQVLTKTDPLQWIEIARFYYSQGKATLNPDIFNRKFLNAEQFYHQAYDKLHYFPLVHEMEDLYVTWTNKLLQKGNYAEAVKLLENNIGFFNQKKAEGNTIQRYYAYSRLLNEAGISAEIVIFNMLCEGTKSDVILNEIGAVVQPDLPRSPEVEASLETVFRLLRASDQISSVAFPIFGIRKDSFNTISLDQVLNKIHATDSEKVTYWVVSRYFQKHSQEALQMGLCKEAIQYARKQVGMDEKEQVNAAQAADESRLWMAKCFAFCENADSSIMLLDKYSDLKKSLGIQYDLTLAQAFLVANNQTKAKELLLPLSKTDNNEALSYEMDLLKHYKPSLTKAIDSLMASLYPVIPESVFQMTHGDTIRFLREKAWDLYDLNNFSAAVENCSKALHILEKDGNRIDTRLLVNVLGAWGLSYYLVFNGDYKEAIEVAEKAIAIDPSQVSTQKNRGHAYLLSGNLEKAKEAYTIAADQIDNEWGGMYKDWILLELQLLVKNAKVHNPNIPKVARWLLKRELTELERRQYGEAGTFAP